MRGICCSVFPHISLHYKLAIAISNFGKQRNEENRTINGLRNLREALACFYLNPNIVQHIHMTMWAYPLTNCLSRKNGGGQLLHRKTEKFLKSPTTSVARLVLEMFDFEQGPSLNFATPFDSGRNCNPWRSGNRLHSATLALQHSIATVLFPGDELLLGSHFSTRGWSDAVVGNPILAPTMCGRRPRQWVHYITETLPQRPRELLRPWFARPSRPTRF